MKHRCLKILIVLFFLGSQIPLSESVIAIDNKDINKEVTEPSIKKELQESRTTSTPTIAPVILNYENDTDVKIVNNNFTLKVTGEGLNKAYRYKLPNDLRVEQVTGEVKYNEEKHDLIFPENSPFNSDIKMISQTNETAQTYDFDFSFENTVSTVITQITVNSEENTDSENNSIDGKINPEEDNNTIIGNSPIKDSSISIAPYLNAAAPIDLGPLSTAEKSIDRDKMEEFDNKFNFTPRIYPGITKVGYNTNVANQDVGLYQLTKAEMDNIRLNGGFYVYYKRAGIYKGRYVDVKWTFNKSPSIGPNIRIKLHDILNNNYPSDKLFSITNVMYYSRVNTDLSFIDSETQQATTISGNMSYGNVDNTEYYLFDENKIKNYVYSYSATNLKYVFGAPEDVSSSAVTGIQGQPKGMSTIDASNTFTIMFEDQSVFPITYGYESSGAGYGVWLGSLDLDTLHIGYGPPIVYGDEPETNLEDNTLEYRVIQSNPSRGGGQTQFVLPNDYKINLKIDNYDLLNTINPSDISVKRLETNTTITDQFDISISNDGQIMLNLKDPNNSAIQKDNFPSNLEITWKTTTKENVSLSKAYQYFDGQGYYIFPISGDLTYKQSAVEDSTSLPANTALAKIKTNDVPIPEPENTYTNITKEDGLDRENKELYIGDILRYDIKLNNTNNNLENITLTDILPDSQLYRRIGNYELTIDGKEVEVPADFFDKDKNQLNMVINEIPANSEVHLTYHLQVTGAAQGETLSNKASFASDKGTPAEADVTTEKANKIPIFNPEKLTNEIVPQKGTVGSQLGNLNLVYVPSFDFGEQKISNKNSEYNAKMLETVDGEKMPNFVQIHDTLQDQTGWKLSMTLSDFYDVEKNNTLSGAQLVLKNAQYNNFKGLKQPFAGSLTQEIFFTAGGDANILATSTDKEDLQNAIIAFGNTSDNTASTSVTLKIPGNIKKEEDYYKADLDWQLQNIPE